MTVRSMPLAVLTAALLVALAATGARAAAARVDRAAHDRYVEALQRAQEVDARLDEEVAASRLGIVTHFDGLVRLGDEMAGILDGLAALPLWLADDDREHLAAALEAHRGLVAEKRAWIERFKTDQAVLRNALRLLPRTADGLPGDPLDGLLRRVLVLAVDPTPARAEAARCALVAYGAWTGPIAGCAVPEAPDVVEEPLAGAVLQHARVVVERRSAVEQAVAEILTLDVDARLRDVRLAYTAAHADALARFRLRQDLAVALALAAVVAGAATIVARMAESARMLRETSARLETALGHLATERDRAVELTELKSRFVSMTSHEFRTPLAVILSSTDLLRAYGATWDEDRRRKHLARIEEAGTAMSRMLDRVLVIGRADSGRLEFRPRPVRLGELVQGVADEVRAAAGAARRLDVEVDAPDRNVVLDSDLLRHALTNLLSNAFKYSPADAPVRLAARADRRTARFEVEDRGIGVPPDEIGSLFEPFHRCSNATGFEGTGLGLAVVKRSVDAHGGTVDVTSAIGQGSTFAVTVPLGEEATA